MIDCKKVGDKEIVRKVVSGNIDAYYCIVENYKDKLYRYILRISGLEPESVDDLLQEVFIKAYKNINNYNEEFTFSTRIYSIAHNVSIDNYRKSKKHNTVSLESEDDYKNLVEMLDSGINLEKDVIKSEMKDKIGEMLLSLDDKYRLVLVLKYLEEKSYDEISYIIKAPSGTVATLINRAKAQFKQKAEEGNFKFFI